jgi:hypothetical protein
VGLDEGTELDWGHGDLLDELRRKIVSDFGC